MLNLTKFTRDTEQEEEIYQMAMAFNTLYKQIPNKITELSYYELYNRIGLFTADNWKEFLKDKRVQKWYSDELDLQLNTQLHKLAAIAGENKSTATQQALSAILKYKGENKQQEDSTETFIYALIPVNENEKNLENVKILKNIPKEIEAAIIRSSTQKS